MFCNFFVEEFKDINLGVSVTFLQLMLVAFIVVDTPHSPLKSETNGFPIMNGAPVLGNSIHFALQWYMWCWYQNPPPAGAQAGISSGFKA